MPRIELELTIRPGRWTWEEVEAFTDRLADKLPDLEAEHAWLTDADLAADMAGGVVTIAADVDESDRPVTDLFTAAARATCGELTLEYAVLRAVMDSGELAPEPVGVIVLDWPASSTPAESSYPAGDLNSQADSSTVLAIPGTSAR
jgi:hypothetical protein